MSEQRIDTGAEAATSTDAVLSEPTADEPSRSVDQGDTADTADTADTEGASYLQQTQRTAEEKQRRDPDLSGREPAGDAARPSLAPGAAEDTRAAEDPGAAGERSARPETGEVSAPPSPERRAEDPGSVAAEFADRADTAPEDDIARPSI